MENIITIENRSMDKDSVNFMNIMVEVNNDSGLGAAIFNSSYDSEVIQILHSNNENFNAITYNIDNNVSFTNVVAYQTGSNEVGPGLIKFANTTIKSTGNVPDSADIYLKTGWNLIGNNSFISRPIAAVLYSINGDYSIVWAYDTSDTNDHWKKNNPNLDFGNDLNNMVKGIE